MSTNIQERNEDTFRNYHSMTLLEMILKDVSKNDKIEKETRENSGKRELIMS